MRLLTFQSSVGSRLGIKTSRGIIDVVAAYDVFKAALDGTTVPATMEALCRGGETALQALRSLEQLANQESSDQWLLAEESLQFGPCIQQPGKIICIGLNYPDTPLKKSRGFFLHPGDLPSALTVQTVEVPCPEAFHGASPSVSVCPTVQPRLDERAFSRMFFAAF